MVRKAFQALREFWSNIARKNEKQQDNNSNLFQTSFPWTNRASRRKRKNMPPQQTEPLRSAENRQLSVENFQVWYDDVSAGSISSRVIADVSNGRDEAADVTTDISPNNLPPSPKTTTQTPHIPTKVSELVNLYERKTFGVKDVPEKESNRIPNPTDGRHYQPPSTSPIASPGAKPGPPSNNPFSSLDNDGNNPRDFGDVVLQVRNIENKFERRQKYQSMFKDAPLYQVYDRIAENEQAKKSAIATIHPDKGGSHTNSLIFNNDYIFDPIDSDEQNLPDNHSPPSDLIAAAAEVWRDRTQHSGDPSNRSSKSSNKPGSPPPLIIDHRNRPAVPTTPKTPFRKRPVQRTPSDSTEMQSFIEEIAGTGPNRAMWGNMPSVETARLSDGLTKVQRKLQEALFEILTSEASYYRSLNVLVEVFYNSSYMKPEAPEAVVTLTQKHHLFSNVLEIVDTSGNFLRAMEACFRADPWLTNLFEIVYEHADTAFDTYVTYVQNQMYQTRVLMTLASSPQFTEATRSIQKQPGCAFLDLSSFLILPMQRVTRLRLLAATALRYAEKNSAIYRSGLVALASLEKFLGECDAQKSCMEQKERLMNLTFKFEYRENFKAVATQGRRLIKEGEIRLITVARHTGSTFQRKLSGIKRQKIVIANLFLFNDLLIISKKRSNERLMVDDTAPLTDVSIEVTETPVGAIVVRYYPEVPNAQNGDSNGQSDRRRSVQPPTRSVFGSQKASTGMAVFPFCLYIHGDGDGPRAEYKFQAKSLSERERWIDAITKPQYGASDNMLICECPQVLATKSYAAVEGDELELKEGDCASLLISLSDGWSKGMLPDGRKGWYPSNGCIEVLDPTRKRENMQNFLVMEEARQAYNMRKARENFVEFKKIRDLS